jgi:hypothetical protein
MINIKLIAIIFLTIDLLVALPSLCMGFSWLINTQAGFIGSLVVIILSLFGYKRMVENRAHSENFVGRDAIDKIEDPYDLYDEEEKKQKDSKLKENVKHIKTSARGYLSIYRIGGYIAFFILFLILVKNKYFAFLPFVAGVSVIPIGTLLYAVFQSYRRV